MSEPTPAMLKAARDLQIPVTDEGLREIWRSMREPSTRMVMAGARVLATEDDDGTWDAHLCWRAMIDEMLREVAVHR